MVTPGRASGAVSVRLATAMLCLTAVSGCDALSGLAGKKGSPEEACSSQATYDALTGIMAAQAGSAASLLGANSALSTAASPGSLKNVLGYSSPTVEDVNKATGKISCKALLRINTATAALGNNALQPNDFGPDHVTYAISYSVQRTADQGQPLMTLDSAGALSTVAFQASLAALKGGQDAAAAASQPAAEDDSMADDEPTQEQDQAAADRPNMMDEPAPSPGNADDAGAMQTAPDNGDD